MSLVTIVIPLYNVEKYIKECLTSLLNQTYKDFKVVIINDGSTDSSVEVVKSMKLDNRFELIHQKNQGLPGARNAGINRCTTKYIMFLDADDLLVENTLNDLHIELNESDKDLIIFNIKQFSKTKEFLSDRYSDSIIKKELEPFEFYHSSLDSCCNRVYKMSIINKHSILFEPKHIVPQEDFYFNFKYLSHCKEIKTISNIFYMYRMRSGSITKGRLDIEKAMPSLNFPNKMLEYSELKKQKIISNDFISFSCLVMFFSIINHKEITKKDIRLIIKQSRQTLYLFGSFSRPIVKRFAAAAGHKLYFRIILFLIKIRFKYSVAFFEYYRVTKFSNTSNNLVEYFE